MPPPASPLEPFWGESEGGGGGGAVWGEAKLGQRGGAGVRVTPPTPKGPGVPPTQPPPPAPHSPPRLRTRDPRRRGEDDRALPFRGRVYRSWGRVRVTRWPPGRRGGPAGPLRAPRPTRACLEGRVRGRARDAASTPKGRRSRVRARTLRRPRPHPRPGPGPGPDPRLPSFPERHCPLFAVVEQKHGLPTAGGRVEDRTQSRSENRWSTGRRPRAFSDGARRD